jgi:hypothetical protein
MFQGHHVDGGVECAGREGQRRQVGERVEAAVVPAGVTHREVHAAIPLARDSDAYYRFSPAPASSTRTSRQAAQRRPRRLRFPPRRCRTWRRSGLRQRYAMRYSSWRAPPSSPSLPAPNAASASANGSAAAATSAKCARSLAMRAAEPSRTGGCGAPSGRGRARGCWPGPPGCRAGEILAPHHGEAAGFEQALQVVVAKSKRWRGTSRPFHRAPKQAELPARGIGDCAINRPSGASRRCAAAR